MAETRLESVEATAIAAARRRAREAEASQYEVRIAFNDAKLLRLAALKDDLAADFAAAPPALIAPDLTASLAGNPRLWIDLVTSVVMEPDPATYRLLSDLASNREVLCESKEREQLVIAVRDYIAQRQVTAARQNAPAAPQTSTELPAIHFWTAMSLAFMAGAAAALAIDMLLKSSDFW